MKKNNKKVRLVDLAKMANVSVATVSIILNDPDTTRFSEKLKNKILDLAEEHNYVKDNIAVSLVKNKTLTLGLVIPDFENPFFSKLAKEIEVIARKKGYTLLIYNSSEDFKYDLKAIDTFESRSVDGIFLVLSSNTYKNESKVLKRLDNLMTPYVIVDRTLTGHKGCEVVSDNFSGGFAATEYCISNGHTKIGNISTKDYSLNGALRYEGYLASMEKANLAIKDEWLAHGKFEFSTGYDYAEQIIKSGVTAIIASNDMIAYGVKRRAEELGYNIPNDISLVGYDGLEITDMLNLEIASVKQNTSEMAEKAITILLSLIENPNYFERVVLSPMIIERKSVKNIKI